MKSKKLITLTILLLLTVIIFSSCEQGTEPKIIKPGRRDYTWTVDTIQIFATYLEKMWGSSPTDVWAVGAGTVFDKQIWHYDGKEWKTDGVWRGILPECIYGFSKNNVWIAGGDGDIWHYDGKDWSESLSYNKELGFKYHDIVFSDIWGEKPNDIYAVGIVVLKGYDWKTEGIIMHYNGAKWNRVTVDSTIGYILKIRKGYKTSNKYYISSIIQGPPQDSLKLFEFNRKKTKRIYYGGNGLRHGLTIINGEVIFTYNEAAYLYSNNKFNLLVQNPLSNVWNAVYGRNKKDIIWMMRDGLTHYNGTDFEYILNTNNKSWSDGVVFKNEVFFVTNDFYSNKANNLIYHGVLK